MPIVIVQHKKMKKKNYQSHHTITKDSTLHKFNHIYTSIWLSTRQPKEAVCTFNASLNTHLIFSDFQLHFLFDISLSSHSPTLFSSLFHLPLPLFSFPPSFFLTLRWPRRTLFRRPSPIESARVHTLGDSIDEGAYPRRFDPRRFDPRRFNRRGCIPSPIRP